MDDKVKDLLIRIQDGEVIDSKEIDALKRRKLISPLTWKGYLVRKGPDYAPTRKKFATDLSRDNLTFNRFEFLFVASGLVCGRGLTLGDLIGVFNVFFTRLGMSKLKFKPAYNPYTEPSMEIFGPEMLLPMRLPEDVRVIAWGLSLGRPTMILYGIDNIRNLFGHKVDLSLIKRNPVLCRLGME